MADFPTLRDTLAQIVPRWLQGTIGARLLFSIGVQLDALLDWSADGIKARFPGHPDQGPDALSLVGSERRIRRGPTETDAGYAARLLTWWDDHKHRGNPFALMSQFARYWDPGGSSLDFHLLYESGQRFIRTLGNIFGPQDGVTPLGSPFDSNVAQWARWWLVVEWPTGIGVDGLWSDPGVWDDGGTWDTNLSVATVDDIRVVPTEWNAAHCLGNVILLSPGSDLWDVPVGGLWSDPGVWGDGSDILTIAIP